MIEQIVGFDAREMWQDIDASVMWSPGRKEAMLIRQDIVKPLSTQGSVWSNVFDMLPAIEDGEFKLYTDSRLSLPAWTGPLDLWENLAVLQDHLNAGWGDAWEPCWLIAITVLPETFTAEEQAHWDTQLRPTVPAMLDKNWQFIGYDISDRYLLSGLMGCGHPDSDKDFIPYLNKFHLLTDLDQALRYKAKCNEDNQQHAPFSVYGLHLIRDAATGKSWNGEKFMTRIDDK